MMKILTSWDDGHELDLRVAEMLRQYELDGIFFIPTNLNRLSDSEIKVLSNDFEIGGHTSTHPEDIKLLTYEDAFNDIRANKEWLEDIISRDIEWFCYPGGRYNAETMKVIKELGFYYARTTWVGNYKEFENRYRIHPTVHVHSNRKEYKGESFLDYAIRQYELAKSTQNSYYHLWGHSWEVDELNLWDDLENLFEYIYGNKDNRSNNNSN